MAIDNNGSEILWRDPFLLIKKLKFHNALTNYSIWDAVHKMCRNSHFELNSDLKHFLSIKNYLVKTGYRNCEIAGFAVEVSRKVVEWLFFDTVVLKLRTFSKHKNFLKFFQKSKLRRNNWIELKLRKPQYWRKSVICFLWFFWPIWWNLERVPVL